MLLRLDGGANPLIPENGKWDHSVGLHVIQP